jgi:hypothetical protein
MHCPACGAAIQSEWQFCRECGAAQATTAAPALIPGTENGRPTTVEGAAGDEVGHASDPTVPLPVAVLDGPRQELLVPVNGSGHRLEEPSHTERGLAEFFITRDVSALGEPARQAVGESADPARHGRRWQTWVLAGVLALAIAAASTLGWQLHTRNQQLASTRATLADTRTTLASTRSALDTRASELASARTQISNQARQIGSLTTKNTTLTRQLKETQTQLQGTRNTVGRQSKEIDRQSTEIGYLNTCLQGVMAALNSVAYNDYYGAAAELQGVTSVCHKAQDGL